MCDLLDSSEASEEKPFPFGDAPKSCTEDPIAHRDNLSSDKMISLRIGILGFNKESVS